jgi:DNA-binding CsgD family transcriptional regulator
MFLVARPGVPEDLPQALPFIKKFLRIPDADAPDLQACWQQIIAEAECRYHVLEDMDRPPGERVADFGLVFCVPETLIDYARSKAPPFLWRWLLARWRRGEKPWLPRKEARQAQLEGPVSMLAFLVADAFTYSLVDVGHMGNLFATVFIRDLAGFQLRHIVTEAQGMAQRDRFAGHGMRVLSDYSGHPDDAVFQALPPQGRPFLMGADLTTINQDLRRLDSALGRIALVGPPRYGFSEGERDVMRVALQGLTDQAIAKQLGLSLVTIKKRWESIYIKVREKAYGRALEQADSDEEGGKIGRRQVLQMMAEHPEEFRPSPSKKRATS